jgi:N-acetylmuramoyl-L-alanine amidase
MRLLVFLLMALSQVRVSAAPLKVVIDAGHGGADIGATRESLRESQIVLQMSFELAKILKADPRFDPTMTRTTDVLIPLNTRTELAERHDGDVFVSIHANSSTESKVHGVEIYFQNQIPPDEETLLLASRENEGAVKSKSKEEGDLKGDVKSIVNDLVRHHQTIMSSYLAKDLHRSWPRRQNGRVQVRQAPFYVLTEVSMPSVLVETGFLTNATEAQWLAEKRNQKQIAMAIYKGLIQFKSRWDQLPKGP